MRDNIDGVTGRLADQPPQVQRATMRLLIIEDDRDAADYLVKAFREVGHVADLGDRRRGRPRASRSTANTTC